MKTYYVTGLFTVRNAPLALATVVFLFNLAITISVIGGLGWAAVHFLHKIW